MFTVIFSAGYCAYFAMIDQKLALSNTRPVLEQILEAHKLSYVDFSEILGISRRTLLSYRKGEIEFKLNMKQIKILSDLLMIFEVNITDLPNDWILESSDLMSRKVG